MSLRQLISRSLRPKTRARFIKMEQQAIRLARATGLAELFQPFFLRPYLARPYEVDIEVTSACDADCIMCPRKAMSRQIGAMKLDLFKKIIDECVDLDVQELHLNGFGEISVLKNFRDYVGYIRAKSQWIKIVINSNGMRMTEEKAQFYVDVGVDVVNVTIDGATAATYGSIRRNLKLEDVEENVRRLIRLRDAAKKHRPFVMVNMIAMPQNRHEIDQFKAKWHGIPDSVGIADLVSMVGSIDFAAVDGRGWQKTSCFYLWKQLPILSDGSVALCCDDWDGRGNMGNLNTSTIREIWTTTKRQKLRQLHSRGEADRIPLCNDCRQPRQGPWWFSK